MKLFSIRRALIAVYGLVFLWSAKQFGLPVDRIAVVLWLLGALVCGNFGKPMREQRAMVRDWAILVALLFAYEYSRGIADQLGTRVHMTAIRDIDRFLFFGNDPNVWVQNHFNISRKVSWYELPLAVVYMTHFVFPVAIAVVLWLSNRRQWDRYMRRFALLLGAGVATYILFPVAPPWMAARDGYIGDIARITARGWRSMGLSTVSKVFDRGKEITNPVAALPSLHAAFSLLVVVFFFKWMSTPWRIISLILPVSMAFALVYFGEHYVTDILAGWLYVGAASYVATRYEHKKLVASAVAETTSS
mgnify:CR=1 FL=1|jgi:membrane-associated phospholipid phosphatase